MTQQLLNTDFDAEDYSEDTELTPAKGIAIVGESIWLEYSGFRANPLGRVI